MQTRSRLCAPTRPLPLTLTVLGVCLQPGLAAAQVAPSSTDAAMYFHSQVQDAPICELTASDDGGITFPELVTNPAATCPDAFAWKTFLETIQAEFWRNWGNDETVWVDQPRPLCTTERTADCCEVTGESAPQVVYIDAGGQVQEPAVVGGPGSFCPHIPGDWGGASETMFRGGKPFSSHDRTFLNDLDPAKIAREAEAEVVYRNDPFVRYSTAHELYSLAGLQKLFQRIAGEARNSAPYRPEGQGVAYPPDAVMFKVDWIPEATMLHLGYLEEDPNNPGTPLPAERPYITQVIDVSADGGESYEPGLYYLASITGASKALPNWHWFAFEHVDNLGRCDFTGCNDSYGFQTSVTVRAPEQPGEQPTRTLTILSNFIAAKVEDDKLEDGPSGLDKQVFALGERYPSGEMSPGLAALFQSTGIGAGTEDVDPAAPSIDDPGWRNYRLKGTQTQYYSNDGYPTILGASITEGGFVNSASCLSCHVQASVDAQGRPGTEIGATGRLNLFGIGTSVNGAPVTGDYYMRGSTDQHAVRTDFVWGILFAQ
jgi:hypothetical protein